MNEVQTTSQSTSCRRKWLRRVTGAVSVLLMIVAVCVCWLGWVGTRVVEEHNYVCPLTGAWRTVIIENGVTVSDSVAINEVSDWANKNGVPGLTPGQAGWEAVSTITTRGSDPIQFGEAQPYMIPSRLHSSSITATGMTREEALKSYQEHILKPDPNRRFIHQAMNEWMTHNQSDTQKPLGTGSQ